MIASSSSRSNNMFGERIFGGGLGQRRLYMSFHSVPIMYVFIPGFCIDYAREVHVGRGQAREEWVQQNP